VARLAFGVSAGLLVVGIASLGQVERVAYPRLLRVLGSASYSLYLWQFVCIGTVWQLLLRAGLADDVPDPVLAGAALVGAWWRAVRSRCRCCGGCRGGFGAGSRRVIPA